MELRISVEDSSDLAFVLWLLSCQTINMEEFRQWAMKVVSEVVEPPQFFFDLIDFHGHQKDLPSVIGFVPEWEPSDGELNAMYSLAYHRGLQPINAPPREECQVAIQENPHIGEKFTLIFRDLGLPKS